MKYITEILEALQEMGLTNLVFNHRDQVIVAAFLREEDSYLFICQQRDLLPDRAQNLVEAFVWVREGTDTPAIGFVSQERRQVT